jgi:hypothetical protein
MQPALYFAVTFQEGWQVLNTFQAATAIEPNQEALLGMSTTGKDIAPREAADNPTRALSIILRSHVTG